LTAAELRARLYGILNNRDDAEDVAQEVFTKTYFCVKGFPARGLLNGWIHRITVNEWFSIATQKRVGLAYSINSQDDSLMTRVEASADQRPPHDQVTLQRDFLNKLLVRIPKNDRRRLILKEVEG